MFPSGKRAGGFYTGVLPDWVDEPQRMLCLSNRPGASRKRRARAEMDGPCFLPEASGLSGVL